MGLRWMNGIWELHSVTLQHSATINAMTTRCTVPNSFRYPSISHSHIPLIFPRSRWDLFPTPQWDMRNMNGIWEWDIMGYGSYFQYPRGIFPIIFHIPLYSIAISHSYFLYPNGIYFRCPNGTWEI